ncbi:MAG: hypothetical protein EZS28_008156 [Streblomastix strix]|uniref:Uncharacterized protein n=1 Tax=Streblomastix strix TaxID=222440 RepID=A0A5J4WNB4_9EUKA|nr:MAG: hypothetical protein EZS28_008156 [Streblomastix strix]
MKNKANWDCFILTGCNIDPMDRDGDWKVGSPITTKSETFYAGDYVVGLNYGSLVVNSIGVIYISVYLHQTSYRGSTSIPVIIWYVDDDFKPKFTGLITMQHLTASSSNQHLMSKSLGHILQISPHEFVPKLASKHSLATIKVQGVY